MSNLTEVFTETAPDYIDKSGRPSWVKGTVDQIRNEAAARGLASSTSTACTLKIWDPNTGDIILFEETKRIGSNEFLM